MTKMIAVPSFVRSLRVLVFCVSSLSLTGADALNAAVITIPASVDADINTGTELIEDALDLVNVSLNRVGLFEFDLAAQIPTGSTILSVTFRGFSEQVANNPEVDLIGYQATDPAAITLADATIASLCSRSAIRRQTRILPILSLVFLHCSRRWTAAACSGSAPNVPRRHGPPGAGLLRPEEEVSPGLKVCESATRIHICSIRSSGLAGLCHRRRSGPHTTALS